MKYEANATIEQIRATRRKIFARFDNDQHKLGLYLQERSAKRKDLALPREKVRAQG